MASMRKVHNTRRTGILPATATASAGTLSEHSRCNSVLAEVNCGVSIAKHFVLSLSYSVLLLRLFSSIIYVTGFSGNSSDPRGMGVGSGQ